MNSYALSLPFVATRHYPAQPLHLGDHAQPDRQDVDIAVRSGDYFITLATSLETIAANLADVSVVTAGQMLERLASELSYVQTHYEIVRKQRPDDIAELH